MKKIIVNKIIQKDVEFYSMVADPRLIAKIRKKYTAGEKQDVQRPWLEKKVIDISKYVGGKIDIETKKSLGLIPNAPILNIKRNLKVESEEIKIISASGEEKQTRYYIMFPETDEEIKEYENQLEIIDGQHRIIAFDSDYIDPSVTNDLTYDMNFTVFNNFSDNQRKEIFMVTNEKQDKVQDNLLRFIKKSLGLLKEEDMLTYDLLTKINNESSSPLFGRIIFGADKVSKGYKENQMSKIFKKYGAIKFYNTYVKARSDSEETFITIINRYLQAWEQASNVSFQDPKSDTITKISGIRYLMCIFYDICVMIHNSDKLLTKENFLEVIKKFPEALDIENVKCIFCDDMSEGGNREMYERSLAFRGEGATIALAKNDITKVMEYDKNAEVRDLI